MPRVLWWSWGGGALSYERGTPVRHVTHAHTPQNVLANLHAPPRQLSGWLPLSGHLGPPRDDVGATSRPHCSVSRRARPGLAGLHGYLAHKKLPLPLGPP